MLFLTQHDVDERRASGFEESNVYSEPSKDRLLQAEEIAAEIEKAFQSVKLGKNEDANVHETRRRTGGV